MSSGFYGQRCGSRKDEGAKAKDAEAIHWPKTFSHVCEMCEMAPKLSIMVSETRERGYKNGGNQRRQRKHTKLR